MANNRDDADAQAVLKDLRSITSAWADSPDGLTNMRTELMDGVDRELIHQALLKLEPAVRANVCKRLPELPDSGAQIERMLAANALFLAVLRTWAGIYYGDRARGDWFGTYRKAAALRSDSVLRDLERMAGDEQPATRDNLDAAIRGLNASLRLRLLQTPPGTRIGQRSLRSRFRALFGFRNRQKKRDAESPSSV